MFFILIHPLRTGYILLFSFPLWYVWTVPKGIVRKYGNYAGAFAEIISFRFLLWHLFAPWKNITDTPKKGGFNIERFAETFFFNLTSRVIGFLFRFTLMIVGILVQSICIFLFLLFLLAWYGYPFAAFLGIRYLLTA